MRPSGNWAFRSVSSPLNLYGTVHRIHGTGKLRKKIVTDSIHHATSVLLDKMAHHLTVICQCSDGRLLIIAHEAAVTDHVGTQYGGKFAFKTFLCHEAPSLSRSQTEALRSYGFRWG